jgi:uncharacterized protein
MELPITLPTTGAAALIGLWHAVRISRIRFGDKIMVGDGGDSRLAQRMRAHANFVEYTPIVLILIAAIEWSAGSSLPLGIAAGAYIFARLFHPIGMDGWIPARAIGALLTWIVTLLLALTAIALPFTHGRIVPVDGPVVPSDYRG